jgi:acetyl-CoA carboxylase biotin carboxyl carrier protein
MPRPTGSPPPSRGPRRPERDPEIIESAPQAAARPATADGPFDLDKLQQLVEMMEKHGLTEVSLKRGPEQWRLRRGGATVMTAAPVYAPAAPPVAAPVVQAAAAPTPASAPAADNLLIVKAPTVGTFYSAQSPEDPPFVTVGSKVTPTSTVCLIEAMKVFNPIAAELSGTIESILVKSGDAVEYGQALFKVRP